MSDETIDQLLNKFNDNMETVKQSVSQAYSDADEADSQALYAVDNANEARGKSQEAMEELSGIEERLNELQGIVDEIVAWARAQAEDGDDSTPSKDLRTDIARNKKRVLRVIKDNPKASDSTIARHLKLSTFLVKMIREHEKNPEQA